MFGASVMGCFAVSLGGEWNAGARVQKSEAVGVILFLAGLGVRMGPLSEKCLAESLTL